MTCIIGETADVVAFCAARRRAGAVAYEVDVTRSVSCGC